jgi:hypothetical protein
MKNIDATCWHGRLFVWSYSAFGQQPPEKFDAWLYCATVLGAAVFLGCGVVICVVLNIGTIPFGVFVEPIWRTNARFRRLTFPGGIPIISVALPFWLAIATWHAWVTRGTVDALGPFVFTAALGFALLAIVVSLNKMRRKLSKLRLRDDSTNGKM